MQHPSLLAQRLLSTSAFLTTQVQSNRCRCDPHVQRNPSGTWCLASQTPDGSCEPLPSAGRYVCNYIYFLSQRESDVHPGWHSLFVHVPAFAVVAEHVQRTFLMRLLRSIAALPQLQTPPLAALVLAESDAADGVPELSMAVSRQQAGKPAKDMPAPHAALVWTASAAAVTYLATQS